MFTVMQICPSWFGILTPSFCSSLWRMYFLPPYIWIRTYCVTEITFTPARSAFFIRPCIWACCSSVLVDRQDSVGAPDNVGDISHMQTNKTKHVSLSVLILSLYQNKFLCKVYCFPVPNHLMYTLVRAWDWRLVVLGWAAAGVGKMSPTWWSTGGWFTTAASCVPSPPQRWS